MQRRKNKRLLLTFSILFLATLSLLFIEPGRKATTKNFVNRDISEAFRITLKGKGWSNVLHSQEDVWMVNDKYPADQQLIALLVRLVDEANVKREVSKARMQEVLRWFDESGVTVEIEGPDGVLAFEVVGEEETQRTYFKRGRNIPVIATIPGYNAYIASLFKLTENQWRNKVIFSSNDRTIKTLTVKQLGSEEDLIIYDNAGFLSARGIASLDTAALYSYVEAFNYFDADGFISRGEYPRFDSLERTEPMARIVVDDIDSRFNNNLLLFPKIPGDRFVLGKLESGQMLVLREEKSRRLLAKPSDFELE